MYGEHTQPVNTRVDVVELPHSIECEQALLGAVLINNRAMERVTEIVAASQFYDPLHGQIFEAMQRMIGANRLVTPVTLGPTFTGEMVTDDLTVPQYLGRLAAHATTIINVAEYARTIADLALRRALIAIGQTLAHRAADIRSDDAPPALIEQVEADLFALVRTGPADHSVSLAGAAARVLTEMEAAYARPGQMRGLSTGLIDIDDKMGGLENSDLIILAGRPSMGKTALAVNIAHYIATHGRPDESGEVKPAFVDFYSLEMSDVQLAARILSERTGISTRAMRRGTFSEDEYRTARAQVQALQSAPFEIDYSGGISIAQLAARARRRKRRHNTALIVVDYLQLLAGSSKAGANRVQEVTEITVGLKALAKELDVPIIALSQLSRKVEERADKRPQLADLRDSGSIEQDADIVMFVYRDDYYLERSPPDEDDMAATAEWRQKMANAAGKAEVFIAKHRHAETGTVQLSFDGRTTRFGNLARDNYGRAA